MRILISGGTGLIGRALCPALLLAGHQVTVLSRSPGTVRRLCGSQVAPLADIASWHSAMRFDAVINLAGAPIAQSRWSPRYKQVLRDSRSGLTSALLARGAQLGQAPAVMLSGSAVGYYGNSDIALLDEAAPPGTDFAAQLCREWEQAASAAQAHGTRVCLLRTGLVLARDGGMLASMRTPFRLGLGARIGDGRQWMSWIHLDDYVAAVMRLLGDPRASGPVNMTAPHPVSNLALTQALARALGRRARLAVPAWLLEAALGERALLLVGGQSVIPARLSADNFHFAHPTLERALADIYRTRSLS